MTIRGIDVNGYTQNIHWPIVRAAGAEFAIVKVTEGNGYTNPLAAAQVEGALAAGLLVFLYHYARPNGSDWRIDAGAEAQRLLQIADLFEQKFAEQRRLFCFLDVERNEALTPAEKPLWRLWARAFREACADHKRAIGWYSGKYFTTDLDLEDDWTETLLWCAKYPAEFEIDPERYPTWPACWPSARPWPHADIWQDGGDANRAIWPGVDGFCDVNLFAGSRGELEELIANAK